MERLTFWFGQSADVTQIDVELTTHNSERIRCQFNVKNIPSFVVNGYNQK